MKTYGIRLGACGDRTFTQKVKQKMLDKDVLARQEIEALLSCFEKICEELKNLTKRVEELAREDEDLKLPRLQAREVQGETKIEKLKKREEKKRNNRSSTSYLMLQPDRTRDKLRSRNPLRFIAASLSIEGKRKSYSIKQNF